MRLVGHSVAEREEARVSFKAGGRRGGEILLYRFLFVTGGDASYFKKPGLPEEARQAEPGPSVLLLLIVSLSIAVIVLGLLWFVLFRA